MGCQTQYSCPITIPTGLQGASITGPAGANGAAVYENTVASSAASTGTGNQTLKSYSLAGYEAEAKDVLILESYVTVTSSFVGTITLTVDSNTLATFTIAASPLDVVPPTPSLSSYDLHIKSTILVSSVSAQKYTSEISRLGNNGDFTKSALTTLALDLATANVVALKTNPSAGTVTCNALIVSLNKAV